MNCDQTILSREQIRQNDLKGRQLIDALVQLRMSDANLGQDCFYLR